MTQAFQRTDDKRARFYRYTGPFSTLIFSRFLYPVNPADSSRYRSVARTTLIYPPPPLQPAPRTRVRVARTRVFQLMDFRFI